MHLLRKIYFAAGVHLNYKHIYNFNDWEQMGAQPKLLTFKFSVGVIQNQYTFKIFVVFFLFTVYGMYEDPCK